jgi:uncharacterized protein (TIGR03089 family)
VRIDTVPEVLAARVRHDGARPLVTYLKIPARDTGQIAPSAGERMELSAASLANAIAKTAGLLRDDLDAQPADVVAVALPLHWQAAVWWGACAATRTICAPDAPDAPIGVATASTLSQIGGCTEQVVVSLAPFGLPDGHSVPAGVVEAAVAARVHPDVFTPWTPATADDVVLRCEDGELTGRACWERAGELAEEWGLAAGGRLLLTDGAGLGCIDRWLAMLAVPLIHDASVVLVATDAEADATEAMNAIMSAEKITAVAGSAG